MQAEPIVRWGVIGAGGFADTRAIPGLKACRNAALQAVMVRDRRRAEQLAQKHAAPEAYAQVEPCWRANRWMRSISVPR